LIPFADDPGEGRQFIESHLNRTIQASHGDNREEKKKDPGELHGGWLFSAGDVASDQALV
jgi:hypothetical protein